jgi:organic radical activating enzyme
MLKLAKLNGKPEIFYTIQGEGVSSGIPAIFIRLSLCNLQCVWCDTPYTWLWTNMPHNFAKPFDPKEEILKVTENEIFTIVKDYPQCKTVVITGGEPLLQQQALISLCRLLEGYRIEVETNGTIVPEEIDEYVTQYNVSPKLANSGNTVKQREVWRALDWFNHSYKAWFKFVVENKQDLGEVLSLMEKYHISPNKIILMPQGITEAELRSKEQWLQQICKDQGLRFCTRLQILLYGSKKGT